MAQDDGEMRQGETIVIRENMMFGNISTNKTKKQYDYIADYAYHLLHRIGVEPNEADRDIFSGCISITQMIDRLCKSNAMKRLIDLPKLGEFYVALLCEAKLEPRIGFDVWGAFEYAEMIRAGKIEVKTGIHSQNPEWSVRVTGYTGQVRSDVLVFIGMRDDTYISLATMLAIPRDKLIPIADNYKNTSDARAKIYVAKTRTTKTGKLNGWYEFEVPSHSLLKSIVTKYIHGKMVVEAEQMPLL